jgi:hypothetical protein
MHCEERSANRKLGKGQNGWGRKVNARKKTWRIEFCREADTSGIFWLRSGNTASPLIRPRQPQPWSNSPALQA